MATVTGGAFHTQYELSVLSVLQIAVVAIYWRASARSVPQTVARVVADQGPDLAAANFRFVCFLRSSPLFFGSMFTLAVNDAWLTFGGTFLVGRILWLGSTVLAVLGAVVALDGRPERFVPTRYRGGARLLSKPGPLRIGLIQYGRFWPGIWVGWVVTCHLAVGAAMFGMAPRLPRVLDVIVGVDAPLWCVFWLTIPALTGVVTGATGAAPESLWPTFVSSRDATAEASPSAG
jgi:hypothetical protein